MLLFVLSIMILYFVVIIANNLKAQLDLIWALVYATRIAPVQFGGMKVSQMLISNIYFDIKYYNITKCQIESFGKV